MSLGSGKKNGRDETAKRCYFHFVGRAEREGNGERGFPVGDGQEMESLVFLAELGDITWRQFPLSV